MRSARLEKPGNLHRLTHCFSFFPIRLINRPSTLASPPSTPIRVATRQSPLALWQANHVAALLGRCGALTELVPLVSGGDTDMRPIDGSRQVGLFTKRIQQAVIDQQADIAVHSLKDLPTEPDDRLVLTAVPARETVNDCLVSPSNWALRDIPEGAKVGTGSRRRAAQLLYLRPDLRIEPIRGNVQTRLEKLQQGEFDAIVLAEAGLQRLEFDHLPRRELSLQEMLPAPGQGALGIESRSSDSQTLAIVAQLDDRNSRAAVTAERTLLAALHGGCLAPIAALGIVDGGQLQLTAVVLSADGSQRLEERGTTQLGDNPIQSAVQLGIQLSDALINRGAEELIASQR